MELFLNLVWLFVSAGIAVVAAVRVKGESGSNRRWAIWIAALCLLVMLFPVISMSDDLQQINFMAEENVNGRILAHIHSQSNAHVQFVALLALLLAYAAAIVLWASDRETLDGSSLLSGFSSSVSSRPPPFSSIF